LVEEFAAAEFAAALGMGPEAGKRYVGHAVELAHRLPRLWALVMVGELAAWRARRVADLTISRNLTPRAAAYVDRHVAPVAARIGPAQVDQLVCEAIGRSMPETAEGERQRAADGRHFTIDHTQVSFDGTSRVSGELDLADAIDLDDAVRGIAATWPSTSPPMTRTPMRTPGPRSPLAAGGARFGRPCCMSISARQR
jgi:hypothetical protein